MRRIAPALIAAAVAAVATPTLAQSHAGHAGHGAHAQQADAGLRAAIASDSRPAADRARDAFRHPYESLTFWGLKPGQTVVEIQPGQGGWWTAILKPYLEQTGGKYVPINSLREGVQVEPGSADLLLVARAFHNFHRAGRTDALMADFFKAVKPGGVLAVEQHRAAPGTNPDQTASQGYVTEDYVIAAARKAGFVLEDRSEINANPRDDRDHPYGVWTLPPIRTSAPRNGVATDRQTPLTAEERAQFDAVGESDRMTLRFRKPA